MNRHPGDHGYTAYPGAAAAEARMRAVSAAERPDYQAMTDALWEAAWEPAWTDRRGPLAYSLDITDHYERASRR